MAEFLEFRNITKSFGSLRAVDGVSVTVRRGEIFSLLGPSGCGKTTLLRMLAGFEVPDEGRILLDGVDITDLPPHRRQVNTIFQNYALFPHLSVRENIAFGLRIAKVPRRETDQRVEQMLELVQMGDQARKRPGELSGGQKQRVAIARALILRPQVLLLDEPLAALDLKLRQRMLLELDLIHDEVGITFLYVTHDQGEAMSLSDRVAVMNRGKIEQIGTPAEVYEAPTSSFVAAFIGDTNFLEGRVAALADGDYCRVRMPEFEAPLLCFNDKRLSVGNPVYLSIRPEKFSIAREQPPPDRLRNTLRGTVEDVVYLGNVTKYWVRVGETRLSVSRQHNRFLLDEQPISWEDEVWISWHADDGFMLERYSEQDEDLLATPPDGAFESEESAETGEDQP
ncbi:MAG: ABC transporter ATP-binding protein [Lentisphaeria bacterium]|nr:ABC transporter ATP-binding protein [Lentisphaeria bacterium]